MSKKVSTYFVFGPVPSRRLGKSLGINNIPVKQCTYSCIYCQIGYAKNIKPIRKEFYKPEEIINSLDQKIKQSPDLLQDVDYITLVPDGEPTLDMHLGRLIQLLQEYKKPLAIITNGSLLWKEEVRDDLMELDLVSVKVDAIQEKHWRFINNPNEYLHLHKVLDGIQDFSESYKGKLLTETMLIDNTDYDFEKLGNFLANLRNLDKSYIAIPTRPPAFQWVRPAKESVINKAYQILSGIVGSNKVELLLGSEGNDFYFSGDVEQDILSITALHPIEESTLKTILAKLDCTWQIVENLLKQNQLIKIPYNENYFYLRKMRTDPVTNID